MKTTTALNFRRLPVLGTMLFLFVSNLVFAGDSDTPAGRVTVTWAPPDKLSEVKDNQMHRGWLRPEDWTKTLGDYLRTRAERLLPPGQHLEVTIDDIKLAGNFEPWRGPDAQDIRIMKDLYPPRVDLHYRLVASDGTPIREGDSKLRDMAYLQHTVPTSTDPLRYDKRLLDDWLKREFARTGS
jgi:hypothetical protein